MPNALNLYQQFLNYLYQTKAIEVPSDFHARCNKVQTLIDNDITGIVNSLLKYAINSASETKYRVECKNETLQEILNVWLSEINLEVEGVPTGLSELSKEYLQERLKGSSFCVAKASYWKKLKVDNTEIEVPKIMWYVNGASIYVKRPSKKPFVLGSDKLFLDPEYKIPLSSNKDEVVIASKPYSRWQDEYPNIYLIQNGVYKNWKAIEILQSKSDQTIAKVIPYLFLMQKGTLEEFLKGNINYSDKELAEMVNGFKNELEKYNTRQDKTPVDGIPFDLKYEHLIPDMTKILSEELYRQGYRAMLSGMGFIDVIQGLTSIDKNEFILCKKNNNIIMPRVQELENTNDNIEVPTYQDGILMWKKADVWSHHYTGKMYNFISDDGQLRVRTTANHSIMVWDKDNGLISKRADTIKVGELILTIKNFNINNNEYKTLSYENRLGTNKTHKVNKLYTFKVDEDFGYFLGWYLAEGYCGNNDSIILCIGNDKEEAEKVMKIGEKVLNKKGYLQSVIKKGYVNPVWLIKFHSRGLVSLFKQICKYGAKRKQIPNVIFNSPKSVQERFVNGLLEGDGHYFKDKDVWELTTASEEMAYGFITLTKMLGYYPHFNVRKRSFLSKNFFEKRTYYLIYLAKQQGILSELLPNLKTRQQGYVTNLKEFQDAINKVPKDWDIKRILKIDTYDYDDIVYDMTVKDNPTFVAGTNILVHNSTRKESVLNPKPFIAEINSCVSGFKSMLLEVVYEIIQRNKSKHPKFFSDRANIYIVNSPLKINVEQILDSIRQGYDRGPVSIQTFQETLGLDPQTERERSKKEIENGDQELYYPHVINNQEAKGIDIIQPSKPKTKKEENLENEGKKPGSPEVKKYKNADEEGKIIEQIEMAPYTTEDYPDYLKKYPKDAIKVWIEVFNKTLKDTNDESKAFPYAWNSLKRFLKKNYVKQPDGTYKKK